MSCKIIVIDHFKREAKWLAKKFPSLKSELETLQNDLLQNPRMGTLIHENIYKIRLAVKELLGLIDETDAELITKNNFSIL